MRGTLSDTLAKLENHSLEKLLEITYKPQARFKVQAVTRCSSSIPGGKICITIHNPLLFTTVHNPTNVDPQGVATPAKC